MGKLLHIQLLIVQWLPLYVYNTPNSGEGTDLPQPQGVSHYLETLCGK